jgi:hypothetical protein
VTRLVSILTAILAACKILALAALAALLAALAITAFRLPAIYDRHSEANRKALEAWGDRQADLTREALDKRLESLENAFNGQFTEARRQARAEVQDTRRDLIALVDRRLEGLEAKAQGELQATRAALVQELAQANRSLTQVAASADAVAQPAHDLMVGVDAQFLASGLAESRFRAITGEGMRIMDAGRRTAEEYARHAPENAQALTTISTSAAKLTNAFTKRHLGWKLLAYEVWRHTRFIF